MKETESPFVGASPPKDGGQGTSRPRGPVGQLIGDLGVLAAQLQASYAEETDSAAQKDVEIAHLQAQLAEARAKAESFKAHADKLSDEKVALLLQIQRERAHVESYQSGCKWIGRYMDKWKAHHFEQLDVLREAVQAQLRTHEEKLRKLSIEYDEELYPHLMQMITERRYLSFLLIHLSSC